VILLDGLRNDREIQWLVQLSAYGAAIAEHPCPRVTEFPAEIQRQAATELATTLALTRMMDAMTADRAFNRALCR
jgi:hypothetical protein